MHPIMAQSFAIIDEELGDRHFSSEEYAIVRRVIHATADFEFADLLAFSPEAIASGITALRDRAPIIVDVGMVEKAILSMVKQTWQNPVICAVEQASAALPGKTRTETGLLRCWERYPQGIYVIGNAPTALLGLCDRLAESSIQPALVIGTPVGFVSVVESKAKLASTNVPQIRVEGRKGGSAVAGAILNALLVLAIE